MIHNPYASLYRYKASPKATPMPPGHPQFFERLMFEKEYIKTITNGVPNLYSPKLSIEAMEESLKWLKNELAA